MLLIGLGFQDMVKPFRSSPNLQLVAPHLASHVTWTLWHLRSTQLQGQDWLEGYRLSHVAAEVARRVILPLTLPLTVAARMI